MKTKYFYILLVASINHTNNQQIKSSYFYKKFIESLIVKPYIKNYCAAILVALHPARK